MTLRPRLANRGSRALAASVGRGEKTNSASIASGSVGFTTRLPTSSLKRNSPRDFTASRYLFPALSWPVTVVTSKNGWSESMLTYLCPIIPVAASTATLLLLKSIPRSAGPRKTTKICMDASSTGRCSFHRYNPPAPDSRTLDDAQRRFRTQRVPEKDRGDGEQFEHPRRPADRIGEDDDRDTRRRLEAREVSGGEGARDGPNQASDHPAL